jgi:uncharacterized protein
MPADDLHPDLAPAERQRLFRQGIELFNRGAFFECHEAFEEIWRSTTPEPRDLFQGLIQVAIGLYHYRVRGRADVGRRVLVKGRRRLERVADRIHGLDLELLLREVAAWEEWLELVVGEPPPDPQIVILDPWPR